MYIWRLEYISVTDFPLTLTSFTPAVLIFCPPQIVSLQLGQLLKQAAPGQPLCAPVLRWRWRKTTIQRLIARHP